MNADVVRLSEVYGEASRIRTQRCGTVHVATRTLRRVALAVGILAPSFAAAQDTPTAALLGALDAHAATASRVAPWRMGWSPLRTSADAPRGLQQAALPSLDETQYAARISPFWIAGVPDVQRRADSSRYRALLASRATANGTYRRPFDIASSSVAVVEGIGWSPVGNRTQVIGHVLVSRESNATSAFTSRVTPYTASPFLLADSVTPPMRRDQLRMEGGLLTGLGSLHLGILAALDAREHNSVDFPLRRNGRALHPSVVVGLAHGIPRLPITVGIHARWSEPVETQLLNPIPLPTAYYPVRGLDGPPALSIRNSNSLFTRTLQRVQTRGASAQLHLGSIDATLVGERTKRADDQYFDPFTLVRATDQWRAEGTELRGAVQRAVGSRTTITALAAYATLSGEGRRADLRGLAVEGSDTRSAFEVRAHHRWRGTLFLAGGGAVRHETRRSDYVARSALAFVTTQPFGQFAMVRPVGPVELHGAFTLAGNTATGTVPATPGSSANYQQLLAPGFAYSVATSRASGVSASAALPTTRARYVLSVRHDRAAPTVATNVRLIPQGNRRTTVLSFAVEPR
jgi:hypothetical protein